VSDVRYEDAARRKLLRLRRLRFHQRLQLEMGNIASDATAGEASGCRQVRRSGWSEGASFGPVGQVVLTALRAVSTTGTGLDPRWVKIPIGGAGKPPNSVRADLTGSASAWPKRSGRIAAVGVAVSAESA
jgi:hypothetical protein